MKKEKSKTLYIKRINNVLDYIKKHYYDTLDLSILSKEACFSSFHFHRIFSSIVGETPNNYIRRIRLEKSINMILKDRKTQITEIALECGFSSQTNYSKAFKNFFGISPKKIKQMEYEKIIKFFEKKSKNGDVFNDKIQYNNNNSMEESIKKNIQIVDLPDYKAAYARYIGPYGIKIRLAWNKILTWGKKNKIINEKTKKIGMTYDNPHITDDSKCQYDACITINEDLMPDEEIGIKIIKGGKYCKYNYLGNKENIKSTVADIYRYWLINSGYQPDDKAILWFFNNSIIQHILNKFDIDICIPITNL